MKDYKNKDWLNQKYSIEKLDSYQIAKLCNCVSSTIRCWLRRFNIPIRSNGEAHHLSYNNHCNLSKEAIEWINGELLGDGYLRLISSYSANFQYSSKYLEYIQYISDTLQSFGIERSGKIRKRYHKDMDYYSYSYQSHSYKKLLPIRKQWYPNNKKIVPKDIKLTPLVCRQWFIGDGSLIHQKKSNKPYIKLATCGFLIKDVENLIKKLREFYFIITRQMSSNSIHISTKSTKDFLNYIGYCPVECYQYKWSY